MIVILDDQLDPYGPASVSTDNIFIRSSEGMILIQWRQEIFIWARPEWAELAVLPHHHHPGEDWTCQRIVTDNCQALTSPAWLSVRVFRAQWTTLEGSQTKMSTDSFVGFSIADILHILSNTDLEDKFLTTGLATLQLSENKVNSVKA